MKVRLFVDGRDLHELLRDKSLLGGRPFDAINVSNVPDYTNIMSLMLDVWVGGRCKFPLHPDIESALNASAALAAGSSSSASALAPASNSVSSSTSSSATSSSTSSFSTSTTASTSAASAAATASGASDALAKKGKTKTTKKGSKKARDAGTHIMSELLVLLPFYMAAGSNAAKGYLYALTRVSKAEVELPAYYGMRLDSHMNSMDLLLHMATPPKSLPPPGDVHNFILTLATTMLTPAPLHPVISEDRLFLTAVNAFQLVRLIVGMMSALGHAAHHLSSTLETICQGKCVKVNRIHTKSSHAMPEENPPPVMVNFSGMALDVASALAAHGCAWPVRHVFGYRAATVTTRKGVEYVNSVWGSSFYPSPWIGALLVHRTHSMLSVVRDNMALGENVLLSGHPSVSVREQTLLYLLLNATSVDNTSSSSSSSSSGGGSSGGGSSGGSSKKRSNLSQSEVHLLSMVRLSNKTPEKFFPQMVDLWMTSEFFEQRGSEFFVFLVSMDYYSVLCELGSLSSDFEVARPL